eukprot:2590329-Prymnesium_polylepis.1
MNGSFNTDVLRYVTCMNRAHLTYVRDTVVAGEWNTVHGQTLRCEGFRIEHVLGGQASDTRERSLPS